MGSNAERLKRYRAKMDAAGFKRLSLYAAPELDELLRRERQSGECMGRTLERLLLGQAAKRPDYYTPTEMAARAAKRAARLNRSNGLMWVWKYQQPKHGRVSMEILDTLKKRVMVVIVSRL